MTGAAAPFPAAATATWRTILLAWGLLCLVMIVAALPQIRSGALPDPDDALRLVQLRDLLAGQSWFDLVQRRIDPPAGVAMHWSRLVDVPLMIAMTLFGESAALVVVPLLTLGVLVWVSGQLAARLTGGDSVLYAGLVCGFVPALVMQVQPLRIDHHGWQAACVALALLALHSRSPRRGGALAGLALATGLTISVELLPLAGAFAAVLAFRWWRGRDRGDGLTAFLQVLALALPVLFLLTRGLGDLTPWCDAISPPHLLFFTVVAVGATLAHWFRLLDFPAMALVAAGGIAGAALIGLTAPACLAPPFAGLDPLVRDYWYVNIAEGQPLWHQPPSRSLPGLVPLVAALGACATLWRAAPAAERSWWAEHAALLLAALVMGLLVARSLAFAAVIGAVPLGWLMARLMARLRGPATLPGKVLAAAVLLLVLIPAAPVTLAYKLAPAPSGTSSGAASGAGAEPAPVRLADAACDVRARAASLAKLPRGVVFAPLDLGPSILLESPHAVIATSHHRAEAAMADVIRAFIAPPPAARAIVQRHGADYLALCIDLAEPRLYAARHPDGLAARLAAGEVPDWLEPVPALGTAQFRLFRVRPGGTAALSR